MGEEADGRGGRPHTAAASCPLHLHSLTRDCRLLVPFIVFALSTRRQLLHSALSFPWSSVKRLKCSHTPDRGSSFRFRLWVLASAMFVQGRTDQKNGQVLRYMRCSTGKKIRSQSVRNSISIARISRDQCRSCWISPGSAYTHDESKKNDTKNTIKKLDTGTSSCSLSFPTLFSHDYKAASTLRI